MHNLLSRGQILGTLEDYAGADEAAAVLFERAPDRAETYVARAQVHARLHRFDEALRDIEQAAQHKASPAQLDTMRAVILQATGQLAEALVLRQRAARDRPSIATLGALGTLYGELGDTEKAEAAFREALSVYKSVSPIQIAWLCTGWGRLYENNSDFGRARHMYEIAHARLPEYAEATGRLAGVLAHSGDLEPAAALLRQLVTTATDPEYAGQLGAIEAKLGNGEPAAQFTERATAAYTKWLDTYPRAFADHGARFFLGPGKNPTRAHQLAQQNLANRKSDAAYTLAIEAALAAKANQAACSTADLATQLTHPSKRLLFHAWRAFGACGMDKKVADLSSRLGMEQNIAP